MKMMNIALRISVSLALGCTISVQAKLHLCPSAHSILQTINNKNMIQQSYSEIGAITYASSFDTEEYWLFYFGTSNQPTSSLDQIWNSFRKSVAKYPNTPQYAKDEGDTWQCEYDLNRYNNPGYYYQDASAVLKSSATKHLCPTASSIKQHIDVNSMQFKYRPTYPGMMIGYDYATLNLSDSFGTNEHWLVHYEVRDINNLDEGKKLYQDYIGHFSDETLYAKDEGYKWVCYYNTDTEDYQSKYNIGDAIYNGHEHQLYLILKSE